MHLLALCLGHNNQVGDLSDLTLGSCVVRLLGNLTGAVQAQGVRNGDLLFAAANQGKIAKIAHLVVVTKA